LVEVNIFVFTTRGVATEIAVEPGNRWPLRYTRVAIKPLGEVVIN
jgi:hypothetical protein